MGVFDKLSLKNRLAGAMDFLVERLRKKYLVKLRCRIVEGGADVDLEIKLRNPKDKQKLP